INALVMAPFGLFPPRVAYRLSQGVNVLLAFLVGWGVCRLTEGRIWCPIATAVVLVFPGFAGAINLGQNAVLALTFLTWGWLFIARGRPVLGGLTWGCLAFKPVWAAAFFLVPVLTRRWRVCCAMLAAGAALALLSLPVVGWASWLDWL